MKVKSQRSFRAGVSALVGAAALLAGVAHAQQYPSQPIEVANKPGGSGAIAFNYVKGKKGDGHVVLAMATGSFLSAMGRPDLGLGLEHFTPLTAYAMDPQVIAVPAGSKFKTMKDLV